MSSVYQKSALVFRVVGAPYMIAACVAMTQAAPGVCISPATAMLVVSGHCKSTCIPTESRDPGCWGSWLCHESVIAVAISLWDFPTSGREGLWGHLYQDIHSRGMAASVALITLVFHGFCAELGVWVLPWRMRFTGESHESLS